MFLPVWDAVAREFSSEQDILFAKVRASFQYETRLPSLAQIDGNSNDIDGIPSMRYPSLVFYHKSNKNVRFYLSLFRSCGTCIAATNL